MSDKATQTAEPQSLIGVLCGSFRRDPEGLRSAKEELLTAGCQLLSPVDLSFVDEVDGFVIADHERSDHPHEIESKHLEAIAASDFVWLHTSDGYVGRSASMEVGFASGLGIPVFCSRPPADIVLASMVRVVATVRAATQEVSEARRSGLGRPLRVLQAYYEAVAKYRGYTDESPEDIMLLITEEIGELARAVRKRIGLIREAGFANEDPAEELADVQLYLVHLANRLGVDLAAAVSRKEAVNARRHATRSGPSLPEDEQSVSDESRPDDGRSDAEQKLTQEAAVG
jgi:NTP pyrophosphatase (non-canonical NTP hydrolase)